MCSAAMSGNFSLASARNICRQKDVRQSLNNPMWDYHIPLKWSILTW